MTSTIKDGLESAPTAKGKMDECDGHLVLCKDQGR